jgi:hypothetical protein
MTALQRPPHSNVPHPSPTLSPTLATFRLPRYTRAALSRHPWRLGGAAAFGLMPGGGFIS